MANGRSRAHPPRHQAAGPRPHDRDRPGACHGRRPRVHGGHRRPGRSRPLRRGRRVRGQPALHQQRRPHGRHGPPHGRLAGLSHRQARRRCTADLRHLAGSEGHPVHRPSRRAPGTAGRAADGLRRPGHPQRAEPQAGQLHRLRLPPRQADRTRHARRSHPLHPRRGGRSGQGTPLQGGPRGQGRRPDRLHPEDGHRGQRPGPLHRTAPPRLPLAARRRGAARRPHHPPVQPERAGEALPLRAGGQLRQLHVADRRAQGTLHRADPHRPLDRRPRRRRRGRRPGEGLPGVRRGQGAGHR